MSQADKKARKLSLEALEAALEAAEPQKALKSRITLDGSALRVGLREFDLKKLTGIYVVGGGKASGKMAETLESILGSQISRGIVNVPRNSGPYRTRAIKINEAGHPIPDISGMEGAREMLDVLSHLKESDLVLCLVSGGGSSLMPLPRGEVTLDDKQWITDALLRSGAPINEINTVRKHISGLKGGWLAKTAFPATIINLILSDVVGDPLEFIASGPTVPDSTTFSDAIRVLKLHGLWRKTPPAVKNLLLMGEKGLVPETPKENDEAFGNAYNVLVGNNRVSTSGAYANLQDAGLNCILLTSSVEGEARHVGTVLGSIAVEVENSGHPLPRPCGIVVGGETTVAVSGSGKGGRNQEIVLSSAMRIHGIEGVAVASFNTDGIDGPTNAAGAVADGKTLARSEKQGMNAKGFLAQNDSYNFFSRLGDLIFTGPTGTNVNDVSVIVLTT
ncbi:MAG: glycerate kinase [Candidatus Bathyarchaeota archaeon]|nr:MAG: glycerate kinase [Candidatus Bathyarchaeota archaeon]